MTSASGTTHAEASAYPGARRPDRRRDVSSDGVRLSVSEWGAPDAPPLLLAHGGFDFAGTYDVFAPLIAEGGWRVVCWDQRGHGDSAKAHLYSWQADLRDAAAVLDSIGEEPVPFMGHSKGGNLMLHLANAMPHRIASLVNIDGLPSRARMADISEHERSKMMRSELEAWLAHRRRTASRQRRPGTIDELAERRGRMNPRLSQDWLRYLVTVGAAESADGWRWKIDPTLRMGGFGPYNPEWSLLQLPALSVPMLGILGGERETMSSGITAESVEPYLPPTGRVETVPDAGHFVHIEKPQTVAALALEFLQ